MFINASITKSSRAKKIYVGLALLVLWVIVYLNLERIADAVVYGLIGLQAGSKLGDALRFFVFETPKVMLLLVLIVFAVGIIRSFFSPEKTRKALEGKSLFTGNILASVLGIFTPFCSCSAIPLFLGFVEAGIPLGVTFSFLIAAPMINEVALILLISLFGWRVAVIYVLTGLIIAIISGFILEKLNLQKYVAEWVYKVKAKTSLVDAQKITFSSRVDAGYQAVREIVGKIWPYVLLGIAIGAGAHGYVPSDYLAESLGSGNWYSVLVAIIIGVPLYSSAVAIIPVVSVMIEKGVSLGTALAFMMSVIGLSLPEIVILKKVLKWQLITIFVGIVTIGIIVVGYIFNFVVFL